MLLEDCLDDFIRLADREKRNLPVGLLGSLAALTFARDLSIEEGEEKPDIWDDDKEFPPEDWQSEVANGDTRGGYRDWVEGKREQARDEEEG